MEVKCNWAPVSLCKNAQCHLNVPVWLPATEHSLLSPHSSPDSRFVLLFHLSFLASMFSLSCDQPFYNPSVYYYSLPWEQPDGGSVPWEWMGVALLASWFSTWRQGLAESPRQGQSSPCCCCWWSWQLWPSDTFFFPVFLPFLSKNWGAPTL